MRNNPLSRAAALWMAVFLCVMCAFGAEAEAKQEAGAETVIQRPDQSFTIGVYEYAAVSRMPGAVIRSFARPSNGVAGTDALSGDICGYQAGQATISLEEYDPDKNIVYKTTVHVTVQARDKAIAWDYDSARRQVYQQHKDYWRVGETFQTGFRCTRNGQPVKLIYSSNMPEVIRVDQNGLVTMVSPGIAVITARAEGTNEGQTQRFRVYEAKDGYTMTQEGHIVVYNEGTGALQVYQRPDDASPVIDTMTSWLDESFSLLEKGEAYCKVLVHGKVGYVKTSQLSFTGLTGTEKPQSASDNGVQQPAASNGDLVVRTGNTGKLHLRAKASTASASLGLYPNGTPVQGIDLGNGWARVTVGGQSGYMMTKFLAATGAAADQPDQTAEKAQEAAASDQTPAAGPVKQYVVRTGNPYRLNLRADAVTSSASLGLYANGTSLQGVDLGNGWARVTVGGQSGYMMTRFLAVTGESKPETPKAEEPAAEEAKPEDAKAEEAKPEESKAEEPKEASDGQPSSAATVRHPRGSFVNLRSTPGERKGNILSSIPSGSRVEVLQWGAWWSRIRWNGTEGYMVTSYLK